VSAALKAGSKYFARNIRERQAATCKAGRALLIRWGVAVQIRRALVGMRLSVASCPD